MSTIRSSFSRGFTLIETLIVVGILGSLMTVGSMAYSNTVQNSRDAKRVADIQSIRGQVELYKSAQSVQAYPPNIAAIKTFSGSSTSIPVDPKTKNDYVYVAAPQGCTNTAPNYCTSYTLTATLEKSVTSYVVTPKSVQTVTSTPIPPKVPTTAPTLTSIPTKFPTTPPKATSTPTRTPTPIVVNPTALPTVYRTPTPICVPLGSSCSLSGTRCCSGTCSGGKCTVVGGSTGIPSHSQ